ncbi:MOSC N-terminal beta barrel domain-containing protein [Pararhizobium sp.]|uniref:MOSC N-terminal beta barrel domain-containing protein n=1 Tax=Pararhizobium sp. TaxID=1977563 RepID=UPI003D0F0658
MAEFWGSVTELWRYPVSALRGERIDWAPLDAHGVLHDRGWGLIDAAGSVASPETERRWRFVPDMMARIGSDGVEINTDGAAWASCPIGRRQCCCLPTRRVSRYVSPLGYHDGNCER